MEQNSERFSSRENLNCTFYSKNAVCAAAVMRFDILRVCLLDEGFAL